MASLLLVLALAAPGLSLPGVKFPTPTGDVWVETASPGAGKTPEGVGRGVIEAPPERVFRALADYGHWSEFMPFLVKSDAMPPAEGTTLAGHVMQLPAPP